MKHISVLLEPTINALNIKNDGIYVDCTLGYAGHSSAILKRLKKGKLYAFDQDEDARAHSENVLKNIGDNFEIIPTNFSNLKEKLNKRGITGVDGIMFDLGVSSPQLDDADRGFSFHKSAPLDMRMDKSAKLTAKDVVNNYSFNDLYRIIKNYGEEKYAKQIAREIEKVRKVKPIETTLELAETISNAVPEKYKRLTHPARRTFQAIRIEVNNELDILPKTFNDAIDLLNEDGVIAIITFHSLEDKIAKKVLLSRAKENPLAKGLPVVPEEYKPELKLLKKIKPSEEELLNNKRSRSSILRVGIKQRRG